MPYQNSYFELHAGFPTDDAAVADDFQRVNAGGRPWTRSDVADVYMKSPGCIDPHNVPGKLGSLVSCAIAAKERSSWDSLATEIILPTCAAALEALGKLGATDARLEIECPFGWMSVGDDVSAPGRAKSVFDPVRIPAALLRGLTGEMPDIPQWEIHFVAEPRDEHVSKAFSIKTLPGMIERFGVDIEQTIQYRSEAMLRAGTTTYKYISTSYYPTPADVVSEANRLFDNTDLSQQLWSEGYRLTLILEHIVGCFQPLVSAKPVDHSLSLEVNGAR